MIKYAMALIPHISGYNLVHVVSFLLTVSISGVRPAVDSISPECTIPDFNGIAALGVSGVDCKSDNETVNETSCRGHCGDKFYVDNADPPIDYTPRPQLLCSCDAFCAVFGDCCYDFASECPSTSEKGIEYKTNGTSIADDEILPTCDSQYRMPTGRFLHVSTCPETFTHTDIKEQCAKRNDLHVLNMIPVTDSNSGLHFENVYCALCHSVKHIAFWSMEVMTANWDPLRMLNGHFAVEMFRLSIIHLHSNHLSKYRRCVPTIKTCSVCQDTELAGKCKQLSTPIWSMKHILYNNHYCALCNKASTECKSTAIVDHLKHKAILPSNSLQLRFLWRTSTDKNFVTIQVNNRSPWSAIANKECQVDIRDRGVQPIHCDHVECKLGYVKNGNICMPISAPIQAEFSCYQKQYYYYDSGYSIESALNSKWPRIRLHTVSKRGERRYYMVTEVKFEFVSEEEIVCNDFRRLLENIGDESRNKMLRSDKVNNVFVCILACVFVC
jgi:hypothetical protein